MNATARSRPVRRHQPLSWLPAIIAIPVAAVEAVYAVLQMLNTALNDGPPLYRHQDWLFANFCLQLVFGLSAIALVVIGRLTAGRQRTLTLIGWLVIAASVAAPFVCTHLASPL